MASDEQSSTAPTPGVVSILIRPFLTVFEQLGSTLLLTGQTLAWMLRPPYRLSQLFSAMDFIGVQSVFIVALTGIFSGMVLALQTVHSLRRETRSQNRWLRPRMVSMVPP